MEYLAVEKKQSQALQSNKKEIDNIARTMGDTISDELQDIINETAASPFEHKDIYQSEYFSSDVDISKSAKVALDKSDPNENINAKHGLRLNTDQERKFSKQKKAFIQHSEIFVPDLLSVNLESPKKQDGENSREIGEYLTKKKEEQTSSSFVIARNIFQKVINWTLDENFYTGVKHYGSYINQLSKALTG